MSDRLDAAVRELVDAIREVAASTSRAGQDAPVALLSVAEAARRLGISRTTLYGEIAAGRIRTLKVGRRRFLTPDDVTGYVDAIAGPDRAHRQPNPESR